jgi:hypothetical protein
MAQSNDQKMKFYIAGSIVIHAAIAILMVTHRFSNSTEPTTQPVEVAFRKSGSDKSKSARGKGKSASKFLTDSKIQRSFILGHSLKPDFSDLKEIERRIQTRSARWDLRESYLTDDIGYSDLNERQINFSYTVWTEINDAIVDSPLLAEYGQTGDVYLQFEVSSTGLIVEDSIQVKAENKVLKVVALRSIRKAIRKDNLDLKAPETQTRIAAHFRWTPGSPCSNLQGANSNYLSFCRVSSVDRRTFSGTEKTSVYLSSLMYGPGAMEEIKKYQQEENRRNTGFDPFQELKRDPDWNLGS